MEKTMSRKQFFQKALMETACASAGLIREIIPFQEEEKKPPQYPFEADLSPELLVEEAKKMGLNPEDKEAVLAAIAEKLQPLKT